MISTLCLMRNWQSKADYVLQTMWRDLTSDCDIVGTHYTTKGMFEAKFMLACIHDTI